MRAKLVGSFILIPQLVESPESTGYGFGLDATGAGLLMVPGALVMLVAGPPSGVLGTRWGSRVPLALSNTTLVPQVVRAAQCNRCVDPM